MRDGFGYICHQHELIEIKSQKLAHGGGRALASRTLSEIKECRVCRVYKNAHSVRPTYGPPLRYPRMTR